MPKPDKHKLASLVGPPELLVFDENDPAYAPLLQGKRPPTLAEKIKEYGGHKGTERGPGGREHTIDLSEHKDKNPETTLVIVKWPLPGLDDLKGAPLDDALTEARRRMGVE